jgi:hypothetical protein
MEVIDYRTGPELQVHDVMLMQIARKRGLPMWWTLAVELAEVLVI